MPFYKHLEILGASSLIEEAPRFQYEFIKMKSVVDDICRAISEGLRFKILRDYDYDGMSAGDVVRSALKTIGYTNYSVAEYTQRTHSIDINGVIESHKDSTDILIVLDTGSSELDYIRRIQAQGKKVIVIDHHETVYTYEDFEGVTIINTTMEGKAGAEFYKLSAGALTYLVMREVVERFGYKAPGSMVVSALCSMYSDSIDMATPYGREIYQEALKVRRVEYPSIVNRFMTQHNSLCRRFIEFNLVPPINSLFRCEDFELLNRLLSWTPTSTDSIIELIDRTRESHSKYRDEISWIADRAIEYEFSGEFVIGNLESVAEQTFIEKTRLANYTGLVANKLGTRFNRPALVYCDSMIDIKASVRDFKGRNYLSIFKVFSNANGHNSAFAVNIPYLGLGNFNKYVELVDSSKQGSSLNDPVVLDFTMKAPSRELVDHMGLYNEFSGNSLPYFYLSKIWKISDKLTRSSKYYYYYKWNDTRVKCKHKLLPNSKVIGRPTRVSVKKDRWETDLMVEGVMR